MPIIIEGGSRSAGWWWARHLENTEKNERAELVEIAGLSAETVPEMFREMHALSLGTKCDNYFYQANINPRADEQLTPGQWREAIDALEKNLGLAGQPHFVIEHEKRGDDGVLRTHRHVVWSRIDLDRMKAIPDSLTAAIHERTSRELEIKFDLERGRSILVPDRDFERPARRAKKHERFRGAQSGLDPHAIGNELAAIKQRSDTGQSFKAGLETAGYVLACGDRRDFVVIDQAGDDHSLARRLGIKVAELRDFMKDVDPASLSSVEEAKARQLARAAEARQRPEYGQGADAPAAARATEPQRGPEAAAKPLGKTAGDIRMAWTLSRSAGQFGEALEARGIIHRRFDAFDSAVVLHEPGGEAHQLKIARRHHVLCRRGQIAEHRANVFQGRHAAGGAGELHFPDDERQHQAAGALIEKRILAFDLDQGFGDVRGFLEKPGRGRIERR